MNEWIYGKNRNRDRIDPDKKKTVQINKRNIKEEENTYKRGKKEKNWWNKKKVEKKLEKVD